MEIEVDIDIDKMFIGWQREVYEAYKSHRYTVISAGRQSGKTVFCIILQVLHALDRSDSTVWWVAPIYDQARVAFRRAKQFLVNNSIEFDDNKSELKIEFKNGSAIFYKSADKEDSLRGETIDLLVIDEMPLIKRDAWLYALRGTITVTNAKVIFIGTPKGKNIFYELYLKGQDPQEVEYVSYQFESRASPLFTEKEWAEVQKLPQRVFDQEYRAHFIDDGGEVFRNVRACIRGQLKKHIPQKVYYAGVDLAKSHDYTVICVLDQDGDLVAFDRFNDIAWTVQKPRIIDLCTAYNAYTLIDSTGLGDPIYDDLSMHMRIEGFKFTNISKRQIIEALSIAIEREEVHFPDIPELINELNIYTFEQSPTGLIRYGAPEGLHDDIVTALALAWRAYVGAHGGIDDLTDIGQREMTVDIW